MTIIYNPLFDFYRLECSYVEDNGFKCTGKKQLVEAASAGLKRGDIVPEDPGDYHRTRCPRCKRCKMKVMSVPQQVPPPGPVGFTKIPTE